MGSFRPENRYKKIARDLPSIELKSSINTQVTVIAEKYVDILQAAGFHPQARHHTDLSHHFWKRLLSAYIR
jgi:hypothetical protein